MEKFIEEHKHRDIHRIDLTFMNGLFHILVDLSYGLTFEAVHKELPECYKILTEKLTSHDSKYQNKGMNIHTKGE